MSKKRNLVEIEDNDNSSKKMMYGPFFFEDVCDDKKYAEFDDLLVRNIRDYNLEKNIEEKIGHGFITSEYVSFLSDDVVNFMTDGNVLHIHPLQREVLQTNLDILEENNTNIFISQQERESLLIKSEKKVIKTLCNISQKRVTRSMFPLLNNNTIFPYNIISIAIHNGIHFTNLVYFVKWPVIGNEITLFHLDSLYDNIPPTVKTFGINFIKYIVLGRKTNQTYNHKIVHVKYVPQTNYSCATWTVHSAEILQWLAQQGDFSGLKLREHYKEMKLNNLNCYKLVRDLYKKFYIAYEFYNNICNLIEKGDSDKASHIIYEALENNKIITQNNRTLAGSIVKDIFTIVVKDFENKNYVRLRKDYFTTKHIALRDNINYGKIDPEIIRLYLSVYLYVRDDVMFINEFSQMAIQLGEIEKRMLQYATGLARLIFSSESKYYSEIQKFIHLIPSLIVYLHLPDPKNDNDNAFILVCRPFININMKEKKIIIEKGHLYTYSIRNVQLKDGKFKVSEKYLKIRENFTDLFKKISTYKFDNTTQKIEKIIITPNNESNNNERKFIDNNLMFNVEEKSAEIYSIVPICKIILHNDGYFFDTNASFEKFVGEYTEKIKGRNDNMTQNNLDSIFRRELYSRLVYILSGTESDMPNRNYPIKSIDSVLNVTTNNCRKFSSLLNMNHIKQNSLESDTWNLELTANNKAQWDSIKNGFLKNTYSATPIDQNYIIYIRTYNFFNLKGSLGLTLSNILKYIQNPSNYDLLYSIPFYIYEYDGKNKTKLSQWGTTDGIFRPTFTANLRLNNLSLYNLAFDENKKIYHFPVMIHGNDSNIDELKDTIVIDIFIIYCIFKYKETAFFENIYALSTNINSLKIKMWEIGFIGSCKFRKIDPYLHIHKEINLENDYWVRIKENFATLQSKIQNQFIDLNTIINDESGLFNISYPDAALIALYLLSLKW